MDLGVFDLCIYDPNPNSTQHEVFDKPIRFSTLIE